MNVLGVLIAFIEWYDAAICISFTSILYECFFPNLNNISGFSLSLLLLSISCLGKPIGAYIIGTYSDNDHRLRAAYLAFSSMILCSFILAFLPTYHSIGLFSTFLFFILKFFQGIAIGGNYSASVYSIEQSERKYFVSSLTSFSIFIAFSIANLYNFICISHFSPAFNVHFAWRIGFFLSLIFSVPVFYLFNQEFHSHTTNSFDDLPSFSVPSTFSPNFKFLVFKSASYLLSFLTIWTKSSKEHTVITIVENTKNNPSKLSLADYLSYKLGSLLLFDLKTNLLAFLFYHDDDAFIQKKDLKSVIAFRQFLKACFLILLDVIPFQYFHVFLPNYKIMVLGLHPNSVRLGTLITSLTIAITTPVIGHFADKHGSRLFLQLSALMMIASSVFHYFKFTKFLSIFHLNDVYFGLMMAFCYATLYCYLPLKFDKSSRAKLSGLALNLTTSFVLLMVPIFSLLIENYIQIILGFVGLISLRILTEDNDNKFNHTRGNLYEI